MTGVLYRIAQFCVRRRLVVLGVWLVVAVALVGDLAPDGRQHERQPVAAGDRQPARDRHAGEVVPDSGERHEPDRAARAERQADRLEVRERGQPGRRRPGQGAERRLGRQPADPAGRLGSEQGQGDRLPVGRRSRSARARCPSRTRRTSSTPRPSRRRRPGSRSRPAASSARRCPSPRPSRAS